MSDISPPLAALREAGLLDDENRIPQRSWDSWFGPANERREQRREAGRLGGTLSRPKQRLSDAEAALEQRLSDAEPVRTVPSVPTDPGSPSVTRANGIAHDEVPFVALSKEEREAVLQREQDELMRKIGWKVGVKS